MTDSKSDRGSATVEVVLLTPVIVLFVMFVVFGGRSTEALNDVRRAADQGARAASMVSSGRMNDEANRAVREDLERRGVSCPEPQVSVAQSVEGRVVTVTVSCRPRSDGLDLLSVETSNLTASSSEVVDRYRAGG